MLYKNQKMPLTTEEKILLNLKEEIKGLVTYSEIASALGVTISAVSNVINGYSKYNQLVVDKALELKNIALLNRNNSLQSTAKRLKIKI